MQHGWNIGTRGTVAYYSYIMALLVVSFGFVQIFPFFEAFLFWKKKNVMLVSTLDKLGVEECWRQKGSEPISRNYQEACQNAGANINPAENVNVNTETWFERFATRRRHFYALLINYYVRSPDDDGIRAISHSTDGFFSSSRFFFFFLFLVSGIWGTTRISKVAKLSQFGGSFVL